MATHQSTSRLVHDIISTWRQGAQPPNARQVLAAHPDVAGDKDLCLDLTYEEYCLRNEAGERLQASTFCDHYPEYRNSLRRLIEVDAAFSQIPELSRLTQKLPWPEPGDKFNEFEIISVLGRGAFAKVYLATQPRLGGRLVVVKCTPYGAAEAEILGKLKHPHIVPVHSVHYDEVTELTAVCMPFLGSTTLIDVLDDGFKHGRIPRNDKHFARLLRVSEANRPRVRNYTDAIIEMAGSLAEALDYAHRHGVLHRDLKPSNVLLSDGLQAMLLDFNLSSNEDTDGTHLGGTLPYMPPEQVRAVFLPGEHAHEEDVDERSDVFSLGVLLYQLLTGRLPYPEPDPSLPSPEKAALHLKALESAPVPVQKINRGVDRRASELIQRCLDTDPDRRPQTAADFARDLTQRNNSVRLQRRAFVLTASAVVAAGPVFLVFNYNRSPNRAKRHMNRALSADREKDYKQAILQYGNVIDIDAEQFEPFLRRAQCRLLVDQDAETVRLAIADLRAAYRRKPRDGELNAWYVYAYTLEQNRRITRPHYDWAEEGGWRDASLCNNFGLSMKPISLRIADIMLGQAVELATGRERGIAAFNQARVQVSMIYNDEVPPGWQGDPVSLYVEAMRLLPDQKRIPYHAYEFCSRKEEDFQQAAYFLRKAIDGGYRPLQGEIDLLKSTLPEALIPPLPEPAKAQDPTVARTIVPPRFRPRPPQNPAPAE